MTTRYTDQEWALIIAEIEQDVVQMQMQMQTHVHTGGEKTSSTSTAHYHHRNHHHHQSATATATTKRTKTSERKNSETLKSKRTRKTSVPEVGSAAFAATIEHTLLKLDATAKQIDGLCAEARVAGFATVCVRPKHVAQAATDLKGSTVHVASVIGFPEGTQDMPYKMRETRSALEAGAHELDVVVNWPQLQKSQYNTIYNELAALRAGASSPPTPLSLILETSQLSSHQIIAGCVIAGHASFSFVQTSTGFMGEGATAQNVRLMEAVCRMLEKKSGIKMKVKASGGIRMLQDAVDMLEAGATRVGTSGGVWIVKERNEVISGARGSNEGDDRPGMITRLFTDY